MDAAQAEYYKKLPLEAPAQALKPNLTVDLRKKRLSHLPKEVIALIRQDVERYDMLNHFSSPERIGLDIKLTRTT